MTADDKPAFARLLTDALAFYRQDVSAFTLTVWWAACEAFDMEQVRKGLTAHALDPERGQFAPKPADLMRVLHGTQADRSLVAWGKLMDAIRAVGAWRSVVFDDGAIHAAIEDMGGWPKVCRSGLDELPFLQRRFCELHRSYSMRADGVFPGILIGDAEATNRHAGQPVEPPVLVGDAALAMEVRRIGVVGPKTPMVLAGMLPQLRRLEAA